MKAIKLLYLVSFIIITNISVGQELVWQNTIGGSGDDFLNMVVSSSDKGYFLAGISNSNISGDKSENCIGSWDFWVLKLDSTGLILWDNTIGGNTNEDIGVIEPTSDGGCLIGGPSNSGISGDKTEGGNGGYDAWILKLDSTGTIQWQNTIGGLANDLLRSCIQTNDGGYILGIQSSSSISGDKTENCLGNWDYWIVKIDSVGILQWQNTIGGSDEDIISTINPTIDNGFIIGGISSSFISGDKTENSMGGRDYWVVKIDSTGNIEWQNTIGGNDGDYLTNAFQAIDSGYFISGFSHSAISGDKSEYCLGLSDYWVIKLDSSGNIIWENTIIADDTDECHDAIQTSDEGFVFGGRSYSNLLADK